MGDRPRLRTEPGRGLLGWGSVKLFTGRRCVEVGRAVAIFGWTRCTARVSGRWVTS